MLISNDSIPTLAIIPVQTAAKPKTIAPHWSSQSNRKKAIVIASVASSLLATAICYSFSKMKIHEQSDFKPENKARGESAEKSEKSAIISILLITTILGTIALGTYLTTKQNNPRPRPTGSGPSPVLDSTPVLNPTPVLDPAVQLRISLATSIRGAEIDRDNEMRAHTEASAENMRTGIPTTPFVYSHQAHLDRMRTQLATINLTVPPPSVIQ